jgi:hypothetical protein
MKQLAADGGMQTGAGPEPAIALAGLAMLGIAIWEFRATE